jgi:hypothetical protein
MDAPNPPPDACRLERFGVEDRPRGGVPGPTAHSKSAQLDDPMLRCRACSNEVARHDDRIEISGAHTHTFVNPAGVMFEIGCFGRVTGCRTRGTSSVFFSWFPGHAWCVAVCERCRTHLGWSFGDGPDFWGLIVARLC